MSVLAYIIIFTLLGSVSSLIGGIVLLYKESIALKVSHFLSAFAAGTLLGAAFFDLLPEAAEEAGETNIFFWTALGIIIFFLLERVIHWYHHHQYDISKSETKRSTIPLIIIGDSVHNFVDGVVIAATFLVSIPLGIVTTFAVIAHEIPQEIGDFGILLHKRMPRKQIIIVNILSALTAMIGALLAFSVGESIESILPILLSLSAGFFIYIALSDLIPEIHNEEKHAVALIETLLLLFGVWIIYFLVSLLESSH